jgi:hypothetical protein
MHHPGSKSLLLAAFLIIASVCIAQAQSGTKTVADYVSTVEGYCRDWGNALKPAAQLPAGAQRTDAIGKANLDAEVKLKLITVPATFTDADIATIVGKFRTCFDKEGRNAFGGGTTVSVALNPRAKSGQQPRAFDATVQVFPGIGTAQAAPSAGAITLAANQSLGKEWGNVCLSKGSMSCCKESATRECKSVSDCRVGIKMCETMVTCNSALNDCKKKEMATDKSCDGAKCKACTSNYKTCHDAALRISN